MSCRACEIASGSPRTGHYSRGCRECGARALAHSPAYFGANRERDMTVAFLGGLRSISAPGESLEDAHERVRVWARRIKAAAKGDSFTL
jgi:broad specificity phosphatase PhoE